MAVHDAARLPTCAFGPRLILMSLLGGIGDPDRIQRGSTAEIAGAHEAERRSARSGRLGSGTLACNRCDAPVAPATGPMLPTDPLACPFCDHRATVRDFLSLATPTRPARVEVRVVQAASPPHR
jgi:hypothetical protein